MMTVLFNRELMFLQLDEAVASRAVFVIVPGSNGRTDGPCYEADREMY